MKAGRTKAVPLFRQRRFWPSVFWVAVLVVGVLAGSLLKMPEFLIAVILSVFLGLNEVGRWPYKTNLVLCAGAAITAVLAGTFNWVQTGSLLLLLFILAGFMLYFRDSVRRMLPAFHDFAALLCEAGTLDQVAAIAVDEIGEMSGAAVFIALSDGKSGLYLPEYHEDKRIDLKRDGGVMWKLFASGGSYMTGKVEQLVDMPLYREARSLMSVGLEAGGEKIGVIQLESDRPHAFSEEDQSVFEILAFFVSQAVYVYMKEVAKKEAAMEKLEMERKFEAAVKTTGKKSAESAKNKQLAISFDEADKADQDKETAETGSGEDDA